MNIQRLFVALGHLELGCGHVASLGRQREREPWSNNSTGTWLSLFGAMLPATAAGPESTHELLANRCEWGADPVVRALAA